MTQSGKSLKLCVKSARVKEEGNKEGQINKSVCVLRNTNPTQYTVKVRTVFQLTWKEHLDIPLQLCSTKLFFLQVIILLLA